MSTEQLKSLLTTIAENPRARFAVRTDVLRSWQEFSARQVLELIGNRDMKFLQCAVKRPNIVKQSSECIPLPEKSLAINTRYYVAAPDLLACPPPDGAVYKGHPYEREVLKLGLVYLNYEDALARSNAMLKYDEFTAPIQEEDIMTFYGTEFDPV